MERIIATPASATNRRRFLQQAAAATFTVAGMSARSYGRILGANERIRLGGIGPGDRGAGRLAAAQKLGAEIVALADANKGMLARAQKMLAAPVEKTFVDYNDLLAMKDLDGVIIATPDHLHHDCLLAAVKAGKDAYIEKPLARTIEEGENMVAAVKASKQIVQVGNQRRSSCGRSDTLSSKWVWGWPSIWSRPWAPESTPTFSATPALCPACRSSTVSPALATLRTSVTPVASMQRKIMYGAGRPCATSSRTSWSACSTRCLPTA